MAKKRGAAHGGHGWFVTFADLMGLLMSFFVMLVAFSNQDKQKLQIVAGSMREAFGVQTVKYNGIVEQDGLPTRPALKNVAQINPEDASNTPGPMDPERQLEGLKAKEDRSFALAAATLRQAMQEMPEISELSRHIMIEETDAGLNIEIVDQDGRSMFPDGTKDPYDRTRRIIRKLAVPLKALPNRVSITGHTAASRLPPRPGYGPWELSADRANAVRQILEDEGLPSAHIFAIAGKADTQPLFPDDPHIAANRRVTITLMREAPPIPTGFKP
jgi:chemotaxis protein MotB